MKVFIANDHAAVALKETLVAYMRSANIDVEDLGCFTDDSVDYPDYANILTQGVTSTVNARGVLICGSGIGMSIAANRNPHIRAALCHNEEYAQLARTHNDANVLVLGARFLENEEAISILKTFFKTEFKGGKHQVRVDKMSVSQ